MTQHLENVKAFYLTGVGDGNIDQAFERYVADDFTHHSTYGKKGRSEAIAEYKRFIEGYRTRHFEIVRAIEDGNLVFMHTKAVLNGAEELIYTDFIRLDDAGKITEHWTVSSEFAKTTPSGHSSTDGPTDVVDLDNTDANKKTAEAIIFNALMPGGTPEKIDDLISTEQYIQHNKDVADGVGHFRALAIAPDRNLNYSKIELLVGQGNFVAVLCHASWTEPDVYQEFVQVDLFRFENGLAVEHWDNVEPYSSEG